jgi:hypothetical protein
MAKTNTKATTNIGTLTFEGTPAKRLSDTDALRRAVFSCLLWEDQFYENGVDIAERIKQLTLAVHPDVAANVAQEARTKFKIRHAPLWIARWLASGNTAQRSVVDTLLPAIIQRPDELTEFLALYWKDGKTPLAACVKRGLAAAFTKFDDYQLAKYNRTDAAIKLRDVMFMVHPKPVTEAQAAVWKKLVDGTLESPDTWEVNLSAGANKRETFERLISEGKLGALALLRNLRNMQECGVDRLIIADAIVMMKTDRMMPFRFIAAARYAPQYEPLLEDSMFRCLGNAPKLKGRTALVIDTSPSMWMDKVSAKSDMTRFDAAAALAILCREICEDVNVYAFNDKAVRVPARRGFALRDALAATRGPASMGGLAVDMANADGYDRIIVITDGEWHYSRRNNIEAAPANIISPAPLTDKAYLVNVASYQHAIGSGKWNMIDGWSEGIIDFIQACETPLA